MYIMQLIDVTVKCIFSGIWLNNNFSVIAKLSDSLHVYCTVIMFRDYYLFLKASVEFEKCKL